jgi:hypothetical protein
MDKFITIIERLKDLLMFREGSEFDNILIPPTVTIGSIIWGILLRSAIIIIITTFVVMLLEMREFWWISIFIFWFLVAYPAYRQFNNFNNRIYRLENETICGKCKYFILESQLCSIFDEHIGIDTIPCNGDSWEARPDLFNN